MLSNPFWQFSVTVYSKPRVATLCLQLQNEFGLNVNHVLFACFLARRGYLMDTSTADYLRTSLSNWQGRVILPLRQLRLKQKQLLPRITQGLTHAQSNTSGQSQAKQQGEQLYQDLKMVELQAERLEQAWLWSFAQRCEAGLETNRGELPGVVLLQGLPESTSSAATTLLGELWNIVSTEMSEPSPTGGIDSA